MSSLLWSDQLTMAAVKHCNDLGSNSRQGHIGTDGSSPKERMEVYGIVSANTAENLVYSPVPNGSFLMLTQYVDDSEPNRAQRNNMMDARYKYTGMAYCRH